MLHITKKGKEKYKDLGKMIEIYFTVSCSRVTPQTMGSPQLQLTSPQLWQLVTPWARWRAPQLVCAQLAAWPAGAGQLGQQLRVSWAQLRVSWGRQLGLWPGARTASSRPSSP